MNKYGARIAACAIVGTISLSGYQTTLEAKIQNSASVPSAGIAAVLDGTSTIEDLQVDVVQNIAYLESVSGVQPNIVRATESSSIWSAPTVARKSNVRAVINSFQNTNDVEAQTRLEEESTENTTENVTIENTIETTEENTTEDTESFKTSAGFDAVEVYDLEDNVESETHEISEEEIETEQETVIETESETETESEIETETETESETETEIESETSSKEQDFSGLVIARVSNYVNVRSIPSEEGEIVGKLYDKSVGEFIEEDNGWYKITSGNCTGYVKGEYCVVGEEAQALAKEVGTTYAVVNTTTLKVRQEASTESPVLGLVPLNEELVVVDELDGWVKISIEEGDGYVSREYVNLRTDFVSAESKEEEEARLAKEAAEREAARAAAVAARAESQTKTAESSTAKSEANQAVIEAANNTAASSTGSEMGKAVINFATQFVGNPYVYGGTSLTNGADCSGFVMSVYANFGVSLPHSSSSLRSVGTSVGTSLSDAQPGDIICYSGHVALYVGNGQIVHASTSKTGIIVSSASYRQILSIRRIF